LISRTVCEQNNRQAYEQVGTAALAFLRCIRQTGYEP